LYERPQGIFLPGVESTRRNGNTAVVREAQEECGFLVRVGVGDFAVQFCTQI